MTKLRFKVPPSCKLGALHVAVRDNIADDETIVETAYQPDPALWLPGFKTRRRAD